MHDFYLFWVRFTAVLLFIYTAAIATPTESTITYHCGKVDISDDDAEFARYEGNKFYDRPKTYPRSYDGELEYDNPEFVMMFPIMLNGQTFVETHVYSYFVVFERLSNLKDVIERTAQGDKRCLRKTHRTLSSSALAFFLPPFELTEAPDNHYGYQCGPEFLSDVIISNSVNLAKIQRRKKYSVAHPYPGCPKCLKSPIHVANIIDASANSGDGSAFILTDQKFSLKHVLWANNGAFLQCERAANTAEGQLSTTVKNGYQCGLNHFDRSYLDYQISQSLWTKVKNPRRAYGRTKTKSNLIFWPLHQSSEPTSKKNPRLWYLAMNEKYQIICVARIIHDVECCSKKPAAGEAPGEKHSFRCPGSVEVPFIKMTEAARDACDNMFTYDRLFPAKYSGPGFDVLGPYKTWPVIISPNPKYGKNNKYAGPYRIVVNHDCQIAGVLVKNDHSVLSKCQRSDGSTPGDGSERPIIEIPGTRISRKIRENRVNNRGSRWQWESIHSTSTQKN